MYIAAFETEEQRRSIEDAQRVLNAMSETSDNYYRPVGYCEVCKGNDAVVFVVKFGSYEKPVWCASSVLLQEKTESGYERFPLLLRLLSDLGVDVNVFLTP